MAKEKNHYIDNKLLEIELEKFSSSFKEEVARLKKDSKLPLKDIKKQANGYISEELGAMFLEIAYNLINKSNFNNYTYRDEMLGLGIEYMCRFAKNFDSTKSNSNGFSYCTQICFNGFIQAITKEKKRSALKDEIIKETMFSSELDKWEKSKFNDIER